MSEKVSKIRKRDGRIVGFDQKKITNAILKALTAVKHRDGGLAERLSDSVVKLVNERFAGKIPGIEDVQDIVEEVLVKNGYVDVAKAYILYRQRRMEIREFKTFFDVVDDLKLGINAIKVLKRRYLLKDEEGNVVETPSKMFRRVAKAVAKADLLYDKKADVKKTEEEFYQIM
ncbi:MAG: ATP cone domain-containing protein, partial [Candidatus Bathyarchaeia archaeon]